MSERIPVNPEVLRWARKTSGFGIDDVVDKLKRKKVTAKTVASWEKGTSSPTYTQLEKLAYDIYKRPLALFFFPDPPEEETPQPEPKKEESKEKIPELEPAPETPPEPPKKELGDEPSEDKKSGEKSSKQEETTDEENKSSN